MAQGDYLIQNQSFPSFRSDLNDTLEAINTSNSGTSRPSSAVAGTIWLDTSGAATAQLLKMYDGADDILLGTINFTANTIDWADSVSEVSLAGVETLTNKTLTSPKINEDVAVTSTATELNKLDALSRGSILYGNASAVTSVLTTGTVGQFLTTDGTDISWGAGSSADFSSVGEHILPTADDTYDLGSATYQWANIYTGDLHLSNESKAEGNSVDGTTGNWTIQEGNDDLFILNNKSGKKYKLN